MASWPHQPPLALVFMKTPTMIATDPPSTSPHGLPSQGIMMHHLYPNDHHPPFNVQCNSFDVHVNIISLVGTFANSLITWVLVMEKSKSFPQYSSFFSGEFGFEDQSNSYNFNGPSQKGNGFATSSDPELKRKKRIASYNVFTVEGKLKSSARNSFKWIKSKFSDARYGM
ncbi:hypothetical protein POTOM_009699 [Populus tomentosa]|uniref:Uncharacterized protein n=1 Tax=Populus tomentosa TaxID=118781 RepID=A0A8X8ACA0_POPTO|nr:hypothetical protein POTOM_009699 [Populus tomentosa]